ncbi:MAG: TIGR00159 family protein [Ignavibacteriales bacterium CG12_big_fil_rev_8_21_14_0_65_30_8]|nr:MAG: TIGR00159 family protein [Ignavibacteriales bacterium CG12_big_fil_rev_8_21_14_0_65_30_8]
MFEIFNVGFLSVTFADVIDIVLVAIIFYKVYNFLKGTIAAQIFMGLIIVLVLSLIAQALNLRELSWLLKLITDIWVLAFLILFQPEIRRLLVIVARNPIFKMFVKTENNDTPSIVTEAVFQLSQHQHGALIVIIKSTGIRGFTETGEQINGKLSVDLLTNIFFPNSSLHDGAVIIKGETIEAARCTLPLSLTTIVDGESLGMRHRAGLGITEQADVMSVIVSEETGSISVAENGTLTKGLSKDALKRKIQNIYKPPVVFGWKGMLQHYKKSKK